ncbi:IS1634 family transposase [Ferrimicrobium sp.]|uniref:IS1634 family transposase n=1 Tax=Ferrimicrobium sp. TaxID=2926050 RepID=UPI00262A853C|nr:IS1634 family transposase [Ferrimicrobium sp.]
MYIRAVDTKTKTGKTYTKYQLIESYRSEKGPRQRIILTLSDFDLDKPLWPALARAVSERLSGAESIFAEDERVKPYLDAILAKLSVKSEIGFADARRDESADYERIDLTSANHTKVRTLGPELVGWHFYDLLGFERTLRLAGIKESDFGLSRAVILARLIEPGSDLRTHRFIVSNSSLAELCTIDVAKLAKDRVYRVADALYKGKEIIERELFRSERTLFPTKETLFLFDLTNTYFEGNARANQLAKYGRSKEKRSDCPLVSLALVVDDRGLPVYSEIYEGNVAEPRTLAEVLTHLGELGKDDLFSPTIVMDRGIATIENIALCRSRNLDYVIIERANRAPRYREHFTSMEGFSEHKDANGSPVRLKKLSQGEVSVVLCSSAGRRDKESGITTQAEGRFLADVTRLENSIAKGSIQRTQLISERIGRIKAKYPKIAARYDFVLAYGEDQGKVINRRRVDRVTKLTIEPKPTKDRDDSLLGAYVIETTHNHLDEETIWGLYMTLTQVENAFRSLKSDLGLRPIYHQLATRCAAHLFISVLAYHLLSAIELTLRAQGDTRSWKTIKEQVSPHVRSTLMLTNDQGVVTHLRVSSVPEPAQRDIYALLGVRDPLRRIKTTAAHL